MDDKTSTAYNALESMLFDGTKSPMQLPLSLLKAITNDFSEECEVGSGGFAVVYKGRVGDEWVAVKKLSSTVDLDEKKFTKEIQCLMKLRRHTNIVRFLGYCADTQGEMVDCDGKNVMADRRNRLLCFEFVPNRTLRDYINAASGGLEWRVSYRIIKGICEGLHYLHEKNIVHSDLKPANILLDSNMLPKIADFGLSSGYLPQEFFDGDITFKLDIYSLGVIINEILTGKKSSSTEENVLKIWNNRLEISERDILLQQVRACTEIAKLCVDHNRENRPTAQDIIKKFEELGTADNFNEAGARTSLAQGNFNINGNDMTLAVKRVSNQMVANILKFTDVIEFSYGDIRRATGNFGNRHLLGEGEFGRVYKGNFKINGNDIILAVKCCTYQEVAKQLLDELKMLAKLEHVNVVRLVGFCRDDGWFRFGGKRGKRFYICNEYFSNGSLDAHIFGLENNPREPLRWSTRYKIIRGICAGLLYLHELCNHTILHMDLKPSNILLDLHMMPKIADFGLSITIGKTETHTCTTTIVGTNGYMAPEFVEKGRVGRECDIYSLGVLMMAIVMGVGPQAMCDPCGVDFIRKVRSKFIFEEATKKCSVRDRAQLKSEASWLDDDCLDEVEKCIGLASECVQQHPEKRPLATYIYSRFPVVVDNNTSTYY